MATPERFLSAPIPGQSLTDTPRNYPWERPPQIDSYEDAAKYYINRIANQETMDDIAVLFDNGLPISVFVESLTTMGVSEGLHSIDVSMIINPMLHAFLKAAMTQYGVDAKDDVYDPKKDPTEREKRRLKIAIDAALATARQEDRTAESDPGVAILEEVRDTIEPAEEMPSDTEEVVVAPDEAPAEEPRMGLMARGGM